MRGDERIQDGIFSHVSLEQRVAQHHPLRGIRKLTDVVLAFLNPEFDWLYKASGRPSIAPESILRALLLQVFHSVRSERLLVEQIDSNLLFRWFVGLSMDDDSSLGIAEGFSHERWLRRWRWHGFSRSEAQQQDA